VTGVSVTDVVYCNFSTGEITMPNQFTEHALSHLQTPAVCGVYMLVDNISGRNYIGSSTNIRLRIAQHFSEIKNPRRNYSGYDNFRQTFNKYGTTEFRVQVLLICKETDLVEYENRAISAYRPTENTHNSEARLLAFTAEERDLKSARVKALWATPEYRERAIAARKGKAYNKGYKCTPEQTENRRRAGRISNMKRKFGDNWVEEYIRRYPEYAEDVGGS
jgi:group I intron endonuclease